MRTKAPKGYKQTPEFIEVRSRRVQLLIQPSLYGAIKSRAEAEGISVNEIVNDALIWYLSAR